MQFTARPATFNVTLIAGAILMSVPAFSQEILSTDSAAYHAKASARSARTAALRPSVRFRLAAPRTLELKPLTGQESIPTATARGNRVAGKSRPIAWDSLPQASSETLPDGRTLWRMAFRSPGAAGLRIHFSNFDVGAGSVWVYAKENGKTPSAYSGKGLFGDGDFWSEVMIADTAVVEYQSEGADAPAELPFRIDEISHVLPSLFNRPVSAAPKLNLPSHSREADTLKSSVLDGMPNASSCNFDVACASDLWRTMSHAVALYVLQEDEYLVFCTGTLMNNIQRSFRPYFMTANHCVSDAATAKTALVLWDYQSLFCNGRVPDPSTLPQQNGARLIVTAPIEKGDYTLLLLSDDVPDDAIFSGWTTAEIDMGGFVAGIHHPVASFKRFSSGNRILDRESRVVDGEGNVMGVAPADLFYRVNWSVGLTEPGSSGSGLFNERGQLVGVLSHGTSDCASAGSDGYGRLSQYFSALRQYLVDDNLQ
jgi:lysyl endopeptidase